MGLLTIAPLVLGFGFSRRQWFPWVLMAGGALAVSYWIGVALVDPSYDLTRAGQLLIPALIGLVGWTIWCGFALAGRALRKLTRVNRASLDV